MVFKKIALDKLQIISGFFLFLSFCVSCLIFPCSLLSSLLFHHIFAILSGLGERTLLNT